MRIRTPSYYNTLWNCTTRTVYVDADSASCKDVSFFLTLWPVNSSEGALRFSRLLSFVVIMIIAGNGPLLL